MQEVICSLCKQPVDLQSDRCADENGRIVHARCYLRRLMAAAPQDPPNPQHSE
jgi:hypothetical protein